MPPPAVAYRPPPPPPRCPLLRAFVSGFKPPLPPPLHASPPTGANPRSPLLSDLAQIYEDAWKAPIQLTASFTL